MNGSHAVFGGTAVRRRGVGGVRRAAGFGACARGRSGAAVCGDAPRNAAQARLPGAELSQITHES